jgi:hypothetical protein
LWRDAEPRSDAQVVENALKLQPFVSEREFLRMVSSVYGWDEAKISEILAERSGERVNSIAQIGALLPTFTGSETEVLNVNVGT